MSDWIPARKPPKKDGRYLVTQKIYGDKRIVDVLSYAKDLCEVNRFDFWNMKGKSGWYETDSEYGDCLVDDVMAWQKLPEVYGGAK